MARASVFLITATLIVGMVGCGSGQYSLAVHSTEGGLAWASGQMTEISNLDYGAVVQLGAVAYTCYEFVNWTGDVGTIADVENAYTTITITGSYVITANFAPKVVEAVEIWDWYDLHAVRDNLCWNYTLRNDLDSSTPGYEELAGPTANGGRGWAPIGYSYEISFPFNGVLNGQGYEIRDLFIQRSPSDGVELGLFGLSYGVIEDIGIVNATVIGARDLILPGCLVGALVGTNHGTVSNSYSTGNISEHGDYGIVGGLIGRNSGTVSNSYSAASVTGNRTAGGLVGHNSGTVSNSYSTGSVSGGEYVGGLVGHGGGVSESFWDTETSGQATSDGGTGKNTTEMHDIATFSGAGWNIAAVALNETNPVYIWNIITNVTYPFLSWQS